MHGAPNNAVAIHARRILRLQWVSIACSLGVALLTAAAARESFLSPILVILSGYSVATTKRMLGTGVAMLKSTGESAPHWVVPVARGATIVGVLVMAAGVIWTGVLSWRAMR